MLSNGKRVVLTLFIVFLSCQFILKFYRTNKISKTEEYARDAMHLSFDDRYILLANRKQADEELAANIQGNNVAEFEENVESKTTKSDSESEKATIEYHGRDLMKDPPIKFDPNFKNPCWFEQDKLRCLPYMFLIGVKKCGTSDLFFRTSLHPDFARAGFKEAQFFARKRFRGPTDDNINKYVDMFDSAARAILDEADNSSSNLHNFRQVTGEGSPSNLHLNTHWKYLPGNENLEEPKYVILDYIHHFLPNAKIMITFRDPIDRLYSDYYHEYGSLMKSNDPNPRQFHEVVTKGVQAYNECFQRHTIRSCVYNPDLYKETRIQIQLGIYYIFWQDLRRLFPREQILILQNKNLHDKETTMTSVYKFLELRTLSEDEMKKVVNANEHYTRRKSFVAQGPMLAETLALLQNFYGPFNKRMADLTGDIDFLYDYDETRDM